MSSSDPHFAMKRGTVADTIVVPDGVPPDRAYTIPVPCNKVNTNILLEYSSSFLMVQNFSDLLRKCSQ